MISYRELFKIWGHVALHSFGGPAGQMAVIHKTVVEERQLVSEEKFLHALNFCMLLPGPEAQQLATYLGWLMRGWRGGLIAGGLFILPGFISILALSYIYLLGQDLLWLQGFFWGLKPAIMAIVLAALIRIGKKSLTGALAWPLALGSFISLFFFQLPFPIVIFTAALIGLLAGLKQKNQLPSIGRPELSHTLVTFLIWGGLWLIPLAGLLFFLGPEHVLSLAGVFFSKMALVTFGGAYATLSYMAQQAVEIFHWLTPGEMLDGLGMAETTPGPLIQVVQFVGFMGAYRFDQSLLTAFWGSLVATWMSFAPCFMFIFVGAPYVEYLRQITFLNSALKAISAAVVGVIANLSLWFALQVIYPQQQIDWAAFSIAALALALQFLLKVRMSYLLLITGIIGVVLKTNLFTLLPPS